MNNQLCLTMIIEGGALIILLSGLWSTFHNAEKLSEKENDSSQEGNNDYLSPETIRRVRAMYEQQKKEKKDTGSGWDFWDERVHIENLLCKRFNYLILFYSIFVAAFAVVKGPKSKLIILSVGCVILFLMSLFVNRAWRKLDYNLRIIFELQDGFNGMKMINQEVKKEASFTDKILKVLKIKYNALIGQIIPCVLYLSFFIGIIFILTGWWDIS